MTALIEQRRTDIEEILGLKKMLANLQIVHTKLLKQHYQSSTATPGEKDSQTHNETNQTSSSSSSSSSSSTVVVLSNENAENDNVEGINDDLATEARISALEAQVSDPLHSVPSQDVPSLSFLPLLICTLLCACVCILSAVCRTR